MYTDNRGNPITPERMRRVGQEVGKAVDSVLTHEKLDDSLTPMVMGSALIGEAKRLGWSFDQLVKVLTELHRGMTNNGG